MKVAPMSMRRVPVWDTPHRFDRDGEEGREVVFSYGLLLGELHLVAAEDGRSQLASRWGDDWVDTLVRRDLNRRVGRPVSADAQEELRRSTSRVVGSRETQLMHFSRLVRRAAADAALFPHGHEEQLRKLLDDLARPDRFRWAWKRLPQGRVPVRVGRYDRLIERLALEVDDLVTLRPRLATCKLCGRPFVPERSARPERHCRANVWQPGNPPRMLERCVPLDDEERARTKNRLEQRYRRARAKYGDGDPRTKAANKARLLWARDNPPARPPGRQPRPAPTYEPEGETDG